MEQGPEKAANSARDESKNSGHPQQLNNCDQVNTKLISVTLPAKLTSKKNIYLTLPCSSQSNLVNEVLTLESVDKISQCADSYKSFRAVPNTLWCSLY